MDSPKNAIQTARPRPNSAIDNLSSQLSDINEGAEQLLRRMRDLLSRAHGPMPEEAASKLSEVPAGMIGTVREQADWLSRRLGAMASAFEVIETII
jgi:hypothetical protein